MRTRDGKTQAQDERVLAAALRLIGKRQREYLERKAEAPDGEGSLYRDRRYVEVHEIAGWHTTGYGKSANHNAALPDLSPSRVRGSLDRAVETGVLVRVDRERGKARDPRWTSPEIAEEMAETVRIAKEKEAAVAARWEKADAEIKARGLAGLERGWNRPKGTIPLETLEALLRVPYEAALSSATMEGEVG